SSSMRQTLDVSPLAAQIDASGLHYVLSGDFGGTGSEADNMGLTAVFYGASGEIRGGDQLAPVTAAERGNGTQLLPRQSSFGLPAGTRSVELELTASRVAGNTSEGYADNLSFRLAEGSLPLPARPDLRSGLVVYQQFENDYLDSSPRGNHATVGAGAPEF